MFFSSRNKGKPVLVADIDSGSVGVAITLLSPDGPARVLASVRKSLPIESRATEQTATGVVGLLSECVAELLKKYAETGLDKEFGQVRSMQAVIGVPWVRSRTAHAVITFSEPQQITSEMIQKLAKQALQEVSTLDTARVFETNVIRVQLNGYATARPIGKQAKHASVTVLQSDVDATIKEGVEHALSSALPGRTLQIRSRMRALLAVLHEHMSGSANYVVVTVGNDATSCVSVRKEEIAEQEVVSEGIATISRRVSGDAGLPEELPSLMRMITSDSCTTPGCEAAKAALAKAEPELARLFGEAFAHLAAQRRLPNRCIVSVDEHFEPWFVNFLEKIDFSQFTITAQTFSVEPLNAKLVRSSVTWNPGVHEDTGLALSAAFVNIH